MKKTITLLGLAFLTIACLLTPGAATAQLGDPVTLFSGSMSNSQTRITNIVFSAANADYVGLTMYATGAVAGDTNTVTATFDVSQDGTYYRSNAFTMAIAPTTGTTPSILQSNISVGAWKQIRLSALVGSVSTTVSTNTVVLTGSKKTRAP